MWSSICLQDFDKSNGFNKKKKIKCDFLSFRKKVDIKMNSIVLLYRFFIYREDGIIFSLRFRVKGRTLTMLNDPRNYPVQSI